MEKVRKKQLPEIESGECNLRGAHTRLHAFTRAYSHARVQNLYRRIHKTYVRACMCACACVHACALGDIAVVTLITRGVFFLLTCVRGGAGIRRDVIDDT